MLNPSHDGVYEMDQSLVTQVKKYGLIVVSTQVIEAGVDISASVLFTDLAPWSSLVQRFGRCNRRGECKEAKIYWMDLDETKYAAPYEASELKFSRDQLNQLVNKSVGPNDLPSVSIPLEHQIIIRRKDLIDLFDTTKDLSGNDIDISRYIRKTNDLDVQILWRNLKKQQKKDAIIPPHRNELCPVPIRHFQKFANKLLNSGKLKTAVSPRRWDFLDGAWYTCSEDEIYAGQIYMIDVSVGGYTVEEGWTGIPFKNLVGSVIESSLLPHDHHDGDGFTISNVWKSIAEHTEEVYQELANITKEIKNLPTHAILLASRWHDRGKAHEVFVKALPDDKDLVEEALWAKAPKMARYSRPHFRHELASALAVLQAPKMFIPEQIRSLVAYLVAAHHGKVRLSIRSFPGEKKPEDHKLFARGIWGDDLLPLTDLGGEVMAPPVNLSLEPVQLGRSLEGHFSWTEQILALRDDPDLGPFRLAFMEALLRAADQRISGKVSKPKGDSCA